MKLVKYNEALFGDREFWGWTEKPKKDYNYLYQSAIFNEILEDIKNILDNYFVEVLDRDAQTTISKVNKKEGHGFFGRYRIKSQYDLVKTNDLVSRANLFGNLQEDFLYLEQGLNHLKSEYREECIFGEDFGTQTIISYEIKNMIDQNHIGFEFVLDLRYD